MARLNRIQPLADEEAEIETEAIEAKRRHPCQHGQNNQASQRSNRAVLNFKEQFACHSMSTALICHKTQNGSVQRVVRAALNGHNYLAVRLPDEGFVARPILYTI